MCLIWAIAKREFTANILSLRLLVGLIVCSGLFVSSTYVTMRDYERRLRAYDSARAVHRDELRKAKVYSELKVKVDRAPEPLSAICLGIENHLGSMVKVSYEDVPTGAETAETAESDDMFASVVVYGESAEIPLSGGSNPLLNVFSHIDVTVIIQLALSLFTVLIAYDVISGERERGTLNLMMSNSLSRFHVLIGKYIGGMGSILLPLAIGWIAATMLMLISDTMDFQSAQWSRIGVLLVISVLYLSVFFLLSMLISARAARSATALICLLFLWVVLVLVIPNGVTYLAGQIRPIEPKAKLDAESNAIMEEFWKKVEDYGRENQSNDYIKTGSWVRSSSYPIAWRVLSGSRETMLWYLDGTRFYAPLRIEYAERVGELHKEYYRSLKEQTALAGNLSRISPGCVYYNASAILAGTDLGKYEHFIKRSQDYRRELMGYMRGQGAFSTIRYFTSVKLDELPSQEEIQAEVDRVLKQHSLDDLWARRESLSEAEKRKLSIGREASEKAKHSLLKPRSWEEVEPLDLSGMPVFTFEEEGIARTIERALPDLVVLLLLNALLFWGAAVSFLKSEVK